MTIPASAFSVPTADAWAQNPDYWSGYTKGAGIAAAILPSPAGAADYASYIRGQVWPLYKPQSAGFFPIASNVGYDNALEDAANWLWLNDPNSPHNKAS